LGGVLGGVFNAIVAPLVFRSVVEYPLALFLAVLLRPRWPEDATEPGGRPSRFLDAAVPLSIGALALAMSRLAPDASGPTPWSLVTLQAGVPAILCLAIVGWPLRFALTLGVLLGLGWWQANAPEASLHRERTFFGVHRVVPIFGPVFRREEGGLLAEPERREFIMLTHGATRHGLQAVDPALRRTPTTYYHRTGPLGQAWVALDLDTTAREIGVVGLGAGTIAAYGRDGQNVTYFEIDPAVARIAHDPRFFSYLSDSKATVDVVLGDGRLNLARTDDGRFDVLILDAFSSDAIPVHLLTRESIALYLRKLAPGGVLLLHLTNQYIQLEDVVSAIAGDLNVTAAIQWDKRLEPESVLEGKDASTWAIFGRSPERLAPILRDERWYPLPLAPRPGGPPPERVLWTDDRSDLLSVLKHF
jgi:SAM-dependent methyltransferase